MPKLKIISLCYSVSQGISTASSVGYSVYAKTKNVTGSSLTALAAFVADTIASYWFQGKSIRQSNRSSLPSLAGYASIQDSENTPFAVETDPLNHDRCNSTASISAQLLYAALDTGKNLANRYFLLLVLFNLFQSDPDSVWFWVILIPDMLLKELFNLSNETWEVEEEIAQHVEGHNAGPFYKKLLTPLSGSRTLTIFKTVGSIEHVMVDDLAPWLALLPREALEYFMKNPGISAAVLSMAAVIGIPLAALIFLQTFLFEGEHTEQHLKELRGQLEDSGSVAVPGKLLAILKKTITIMGPVHGLATAAPIQITLRNLIANPNIKWPVSILAGLFTFIGTTMGVHLSEVREAKENLMAKYGV